MFRIVLASSAFCFVAGSLIGVQVSKLALTGPTMLDGTRITLTIFVDRSRQKWVVRDGEGNFWIVPSTDKPWDHREPFYPTAETELELVPGHYKYLLGLPSS